jgi:hypothetical protein
MKLFLGFNLFQWAQIFFWVVSSIGILIAWNTFRQNAKLKRAEWLKSLFEKFYESDHYKEIRWKIDNGSIQQDIETDTELEEKLVDYLNFFEFIASLWKLKQLTRREVLMLFEYYLKIIRDSTYLSGYLKKYGFENLAALLSEL